MNVFYTHGSECRATLKARRKNAVKNLVKGNSAALLRAPAFGGGVGIFLRETLDAPGGVDKLLLPVKRDGTRADFHSQRVALYGSNVSEV